MLRTSDLPEPLPPDERTVGQLIAETIRAYGHRFWPALVLGLPVALADQFSIRQHANVQMFIFWAATPLFVAAYMRAVNLLYGAAATWAAVAVAVLVYLPFPALRAVYILPGLAWFAFIGLAVPAAMIEKLPFREALVRGRQLGVADYVHSLGSLAALVIVVGVADSALSALLHTQSDNGLRVALFLADIVLSPLLFLGSALLYTDQAARVGSRTHNGRSRRNADLHPPVDTDPTGRSDPQVES